jgi:glucose/arabinose dehydrogenase
VNAVASPPLSAKTEYGGHYDPFAPDAPLTIYCTGTRNGYDLLWHSNGHLYVPLNGSARGGNAPATPLGGASPARRFDQETAGAYTGPAVVGLTNLPTQSDYLIKVVKGGYYGHPNPSRSEFVMNGGNPTAGVDPCEVPEYPVGTLPDRNWRKPDFDFGKNLAPVGLIEYNGDAFPHLKGKIIVCRYSGGKDLMVLGLGSQGEVSETIVGLDGFTQLHDPLDLCEDPQTGYLYVSEFGAKKITLLRPMTNVASTHVYYQNLATPAVAADAATRPAVLPHTSSATVKE